MDTQENSRNGSEKLNVIFHGAYVFDQTTQPNRILALIPDIGHHSYRAGSWLAETESSEVERALKRWCTSSRA